MIAATHAATNPTAIIAALTEPPTFPTDSLPPAIRDYVTASAASIGVPVEMVAVPLLGFAGATIGRTLRIQLKPGFYQYPTLYLAIIADPGTAKTPALNAARWPLDVLQKRAHDRYKEQIQIYEAELEAWKQRPADQRGDKPERPRLTHYYSTNLTLEALVSILDTSPGVAIARDEILSWVLSLNQYRGGKGSDRQEYLSLWAGTPIKADRRTGEPVYIPYPVACVVGGIQPEFLPELHDEAQRRDGFIERILPIVPAVEPADWTDDALPDHLLDDVVSAFARLRVSPRDGEDGIATTLLSPAARAVWTAWYNENQALVRQTQGLPRGFYSKLPLHVARLALILHALWNLDDPRRMVSEQRMLDAIELGEFFRRHLDRMLPTLGAISPRKAAGLDARIVRILLRAHDGQPDDAGGWVSHSDIYRQLGNVAAEELDVALNRLHDAGRIERRTVRTATKPRDEWRIREGETGAVFSFSQYSGRTSPATAESANNENTTAPSESVERTPVGSNGHADPALAEAARRIVELTSVERADLRRELDAAPSDDPHLAGDRAAWALAEALDGSDPPPPGAPS